MYRKVVSILIMTAFVAIALSVSSAYAKGNHRKGKYLFRKNCRACHMENAPKEQAKTLEPATFTMAEWTEVFKPEKVAGYKCKGEWAKLSEKDIEDIYSYMYKYAKDSPTPAKCK